MEMMGVAGLILFIIGAIVLFIIIFNTGNKNKKVQAAKKANEVKVDVTKNIKSANVIPTTSQGFGFKKNTNVAPKEEIFKFLEFEKIQDNMIIQDKGSKYTMVIQCKGINYDLMSDIEQIAVEEGFINFLNTLRFPIQLYVQARTIDLKGSLRMYKNRVMNINREYEEKNDIYVKTVNDSEATEEQIRLAEYEKEKMANINEYASDITKYVERLSLNKHMLQRKFYVVLSYYKSEVAAVGEFDKDELYEICYRELYTRAQLIMGSLTSCSVTSRPLSSNEVAELLYISYNRDDEKLMDIKTALDSGFYRMYSTSKDVYVKKEEALKKHLHEQAVERIKEAINTAAANGTLETKDDFIESYEEAVDTEAIQILENTDMDPSVKRNIQEVIVEKHNKEAEERAAVKQARLDELTKTSDSKEEKQVSKEEVSTLTESVKLSEKEVTPVTQEKTIEKEEKKSVEDNSIIDSGVQATETQEIKKDNTTDEDPNDGFLV